MERNFMLGAEMGNTSTPVRPGKLQKYKKGIEISPVGAVVKKEKLIVLIVKAIEAVGDIKKGASYQAIKKWIIDFQGNDTNQFKKMLKLAMVKGLSTGEIIRPRHCQTATGVSGSFKLPKEAFKKPTEKPDKPSKKTTSPTKVKKQTLKKPTAKIPKVTGKKEPVKPKVALSKKENLVGSSSGQDDGIISTKEKSKPHLKTTSKPSKQISKKMNPVSQTDPQEIQTEKVTRVKKEKFMENTKKKGQKGKMIEDSKEKIAKENIKKEKKPKKKAGQSGLLENANTVAEKTSKVVRNKKLYTSKNIPKPKRKEFSDTELDVNNHRVTNLKSHSSDTELELSKRQELISKKNTKAKERKMPRKKIEN